MAGHTITPYELVATRRYARDKAKKEEELLLSSIAKKGTVDLLDAVNASIRDVEPYESSDGTRTAWCVRTRRTGDQLEMIFASEVRGEREVVRDGNAREAPVVFMKDRRHVGRLYSCCTLWRSPTSTKGALIVHSPWGRGGSRSQILSVIQRSLNVNTDIQAKLHASPMVPPEALDRLVRNANATKIRYRKSTGVTSRFAQVTGPRSAPAEMDVVVRGQESLGFRDALATALKRAAGRAGLFTIQVRNSDGTYREETFDDVEVEIKEADGTTRRYSVRDDSVPTMGFVYTNEFNRVYYSLPADADDDWPAQLMRKGRRYMDGVRDRVIAANL